MSRGGYRPGGGRKKGSKATHTIEAEKARALLISMYLEKIKPITEALIKKAEEGDVAAIRELHDRVYGRPVQTLAGDKDNPLVIQGVSISVQK